MKPFLLIASLLLSCSLFAQSLPKHTISGYGGYSRNGTGDMDGYMLNAEYQQYISWNLSWSAGIGATLHDGEFANYYKNTASGQYENGSIRYTTGGLQGFGHAGYSVVRSAHHEFQLRAGAVVRLQSSSYPGISAITYPALTGMPFPVVNFVHTSNQQTVSVGYSAQVHYNYTFTKQLLIGFMGGLQNDTEGDLVTYISLRVGKRL